MGEQHSPDGPAGIFVLPGADTSCAGWKKLDLDYVDPFWQGEHSVSQRLDLYLPSPPSDSLLRPVIVAVHGGAWMMCDKTDLQLTPMLQALERGYAVVSTNYRLSQEAVFPAQVHDVKAALRWVRANALSLGLDPERIALWGGSAGAHLSSLTALSAGIPWLEDPAMGNASQSTEVKAVVAWYGPTDFLMMDSWLAERGLGPCSHGDPDSPESRLLGATIGKVPDLVRAANPETYITPESPPFFIQHGDADSTVPVQHSIRFARLLAEVAGADKVHLEILPGVEHADPAFETRENVDKVLDFLDGALNTKH